MTVIERAIEILRKQLQEVEQAGESGVVGVDIVVKNGAAHSVNRKVQCQGDVVGAIKRERHRL